MTRLAAALILLSLPCHAAECDAAKVRDQLYGFAPVGYGIGSNDRIMQVWINAQGTAYFTRLDAAGLCIVSPRIEQFQWVIQQPVGEAS